MKKLYERTKSVIHESMTDQVSKLLGTEPGSVESAIDALSFADYLELSNAVNTDDKDLVREILQLDATKTENTDELGDEFNDDDQDEDDLWGMNDLDEFDDDDDLEEGLADIDMNISSWGKVDPNFADDPEYKIVLKTPGGKHYRYRSLDDMKERLRLGFQKNPNLWDDIKAGKTTWTLVRNDLDESGLEEADNPFQAITPPSQQLPSKSLAQKNPNNNQSSAGETNQSAEEERKDIDKLETGDEIEVIDVDGNPTPAEIVSTTSPGDTYVVRGKSGKEHIMRKDNITGTPKMAESYRSSKTESWNEKTDSVEAVRSAIIHRVRGQHLDLIDKYGIEKVMDAIDSTAEYYGSIGLDEIGSSDVSAFVDSVRTELGEPSMFEDTDLARMKRLAGLPVMEAGDEQTVRNRLERMIDYARRDQHSFRKADVRDSITKERRALKAIAYMDHGMPADEAWEYFQTGKHSQDFEVDSPMREADHSARKDLKDFAGVKCQNCKKGTYQETSIHDDWDGVLHCTKCGQQVERHQEVNETASGGATGAGAVAVGAVAVGGMQKRGNPSIYSTAEKPEPKKKGKKTSKKNEGLGRNKKS